MSIARRSGLAITLGWFFVVSAATVPLHAQTSDAAVKAARADARDAYNAGTAAFDRGDFATALDSFVKANALIPSVQAMYWVARCHDQLGKTQAAIDAYEELTGRGDFGKLSPDKQELVRARLAALKTPTPPPVVVVPVQEPAPAPPPPPPPPSEEPAPAAKQEALPAAPADQAEQLRPQAGTFELGLLAGMLFVSKKNDLADGGREAHEAERPVWQAGLRAGFFATAIFGAELEWAHGWGTITPEDAPDADSDDRSLRLDTLRAHVVAQLPSGQIVPFALLGAGFIHSKSGVSGADTDFLFDGGIGAKVIATKLLVPRIDARLAMTQKHGGGIAVHPEVLLGLSFVLGR